MIKEGTRRSGLYINAKGNIMNSDNEWWFIISKGCTEMKWGSKVKWMDSVRDRRNGGPWGGENGVSACRGGQIGNYYYTGIN